MDKAQQLILSQMIQNKEFHGIPLSEIDSDFMENLDENELRELYVVTVCSQLEMIDDYVNNNSVWKC